MMNELSGVKAGFQWRIRVYYEDTDATGVVYHANYLKYFERARTEWLRSLGMEQEFMRREFNMAFTVVSAHIDFKRPARLDDEVQVSASLYKQGRASLDFSQAIQLNETLLTKARFRIACVSADQFKPCALPGVLVQAFSTETFQESQ